MTAPQQTTALEAERERSEKAMLYWAAEVRQRDERIAALEAVNKVLRDLVKEYRAERHVAEGQG